MAAAFTSAGLTLIGGRTERIGVTGMSALDDNAQGNSVCTRCNAEIRANAAFCSSCGRRTNNRSRRRKTWLVALCVIAICLAVGAAGGVIANRRAPNTTTSLSKSVPLTTMPPPAITTKIDPISEDASGAGASALSGACSPFGATGTLTVVPSGGGDGSFAIAATFYDSTAAQLDYEWTNVNANPNEGGRYQWSITANLPTGSTISSCEINVSG